MTLIRYCPECSHTGPVPETAIDCCPDGSHAVMVPEAVASQARIGFDAKREQDRMIAKLTGPDFRLECRLHTLDGDFDNLSAAELRSILARA